MPGVGSFLRPPFSAFPNRSSGAKRRRDTSSTRDQAAIGGTRRGVLPNGESRESRFGGVEAFGRSDETRCDEGTGREVAI